MGMFSRFTDAELVNRLERLVQADRSLSAKLLLHLGELDARGVFRELGFSSMFEYCVRALCMSEAEAYLRIYAARLGRRFPLVVERLAANALHLSAIKLLAPHLTADNCVELLDRARGKSKRQLEQMVAELAPRPDVPATMRRLPEARGAAAASTLLISMPPHTRNSPSQADSTVVGSASLASAVVVPPPCAATPSRDMAPSTATPLQAFSLQAATPGPETAPSTATTAQAFSLQAATPSRDMASSTATPLQSISLQAATPGPDTAPSTATTVQAFSLQPARARASSTTPLSPGRFKLELTLEQQAHDQLEQLRELLRHQNPSGDLKPIVERAIRELLERTMK